jgi:hypothetical protein
MYFCLRIDLDYVPWDTPDAAEFGHAEPATLLRLLELARDTGCRFQFFASTRVLRAFPAAMAAVLDESQDLDWLCKYPDTPQARYTEARDILKKSGNEFRGLAVRSAWPATATAPGSEFEFISATEGAPPAQLQLFPATLRTDKQAIRAGMTVKRWVDEVKTQLRDSASRNLGATLNVRPQVLGKFDPQLTSVRELIDFAGAIGMRVMSLRQVAETDRGPELG